MTILNPPGGPGLLPPAVPVGALCAYAGQLTPESTEPNDVWTSMPCAGSGSVGTPPIAGDPAALIEAQGWMVCDGRWLEPAKYPALYGALGTLYGSDGGLFRIPDCRGLFLRGVDSGAGLDPDAASRTGPTGTGTDPGVGSLQCDALQNHVHDYLTAPQPSGTGQQGQSAVQPGQSTPTGEPNPPARTSTETRPKNIAVHFLIKFR